jgi:septal ring factor EnvC (AmiA/AmiB activator)
MSEQSNSERITSLEENLNRFVDFVMQNQRQQQVQIDEMRRTHEARMDNLDRAVAGLVETMRDLAIRQQESFGRIEEMQSEVRGLQTENQRMWELWSEQRHPPEEDELN